jgi:dihydroxyacetone kinase-like predicted kinase
VHPLPEGRKDHEGRLTTLLEGAITHLERNRARVNELNVFPVADGDTGDNLLATLRAFREGGARGALLGARGNSGVILSQLLAGLVDGGPEEAVRRAYAAVPEPVEGTMLTVARDMAAAGDLEQPPPEPAMAAPRVRPSSRYRWCTNVAVRGDADVRVLQGMGTP